MEEVYICDCCNEEVDSIKECHGSELCFDCMEKIESELDIPEWNSNFKCIKGYKGCELVGYCKGYCEE